MAPAELVAKPEPETVTVVTPCGCSPESGVTVIAGAALASSAKLSTPAPESAITAAIAKAPR